MEDKFIIQGGIPLKGEIQTRGAKNSAFPIIAASLLTDKDCVVDNIPLIEDVFKMLKILEILGADIFWLGQRKIKINCAKINVSELPLDLISRFRGSILILGSLLARFKEMELSAPGGCLIGARPIDTHLDAFAQAGIIISSSKSIFSFRRKKFKKKEIILKEFSVTATENILLFSSLNPNQTILKIADQDYQVQDLILVLRKMKAKIDFSGPHCFKIKGRKKLKGFSHKLVSDPIEAGTFITAALATRGEVLIKDINPGFLTLFLKRLRDFGALLDINKNSVKVLPGPRLKIDKIQSWSYPGIYTDLLPELGVLATQSKGPALIHEPLFEGRLKYLEELNRMGADIVFCDPHRAIIKGPTPLNGIEMPSLDIRAGAALIIAGLVAKGKTIINNAYQIDRGYEKIEERLSLLGANIRREK